MQAATELLRREGAAAITTQRLADAVGIVQSGFYRHFGNAEACLIAAAQESSERIRSIVAENRLAHRLAKADDQEQLTEHVHSMLALIRDEWPHVELAVTYRLQKSKVGRVLAKSLQELEADIAQHLAAVADRHGARLTAARLNRLSAAVLAVILRIGEASRSKNSAQRSEAASHTAAMIGSLVASELQQ